jgi:hypothetical protein
VVSSTRDFLMQQRGREPVHEPMKGFNSREVEEYLAKGYQEAYEEASKGTPSSGMCVIDLVFNWC